MSNSRQVAAIYTELQLKTAQFKVALNEATGEMRKFSAQTRAEMQEAKGGMALLSEEIGVRLPRHARAWVAELPGVAMAMNAAFDSVVVIALAQSVFEAGKKIYEFAEKNEEAARKNNEAWQAAGKPIVDVGDALAATSARIQDSIAKLEHKPQNGLKSALEETFLEADQVSRKIDEAINKVEDLATKQKNSWIRGLMESDQSGDISRTAAYAARKYREITPEYEEVLKRNMESGDWGAYHQTRQDEIKALTAAIGPQVETLADYLGKNQGLVGKNNPDFEKAKSAYDTFAGVLGDLSKQDDNEHGEEKKKTLEVTQEASKERLKALEDSLRTEEALHGKSTAAAYNYWKQYVSAFQLGSDEWLAVHDKFTAARDALMKDYTGSGSLTKAGKDWWKNQSAPMPVMQAPDRGGEALGLATARNAEMQAQQNAQWDQAVDRLGLLTGAISRHQAAMDAATSHAKLYGSQLTAVYDELQRLHENDDLASMFGGVDSGTLAKEQTLEGQIEQLRSRFKIQSLEDQQDILTSTWKGMVDSVWDELIVKAQHTQEELQRVASQFIDGLNTELAKGMTGQNTNFGRVFQGAAEGVAKTGLQTLEGSALKALGLGSAVKRDGSSAAAALFVQMAGGSPDNSLLSAFSRGSSGGSGGGSGAGGGLFHGLMGFLNDSDWAGGLFGGKLFGSGGAFDHFATGGNFPALAPIDVGELGPERISFPVPGHVTPNSQMGGRGGAFYQITVNGGDPELNRVNFQRALADVHGAATQDAVAVQREMRARQPRGRQQ